MKRILGDISRRPDVTFWHSGRIDITAGVAKSLGIRPGDSIDVANDDGEYYLYVRSRAGHGRHEAQCLATKGGNNLRAQSVRLCRAMLGIVGVAGFARLAVGEKVTIFGDTTPALPLITRRNLVNE